MTSAGHGTRDSDLMERMPDHRGPAPAKVWPDAPTRPDNEAEYDNSSANGSAKNLLGRDAGFIEEPQQNALCSLTPELSRNA